MRTGVHFYMPLGVRFDMRIAVRFDENTQLVAEEFLDDAERVVIRWLSTRTNGSLRKAYGSAALLAARASRYRCEVCGFQDVRVLNIDHVDGRVVGSAFACLCANCHAIKSRKHDWTGLKLVPESASLHEQGY